MYLGIGCVNFVRAFDPQVIVFGGGVARAGQPLVDGVREAFDAHTWHVREENVQLTTATLGNDAGFIGSAGMAATGTSAGG